MNQIRDLVFPPLLASWLLTFLLQGKTKRNNKQSLIHSWKDKFLICPNNVRLVNWDAKHTTQIFGEKSQLRAVSVSIYFTKHIVLAPLWKTNWKILARNSLLIPQLTGYTLRSGLGLLCLWQSYSTSSPSSRFCLWTLACSKSRTAFMSWALIWWPPPTPLLLHPFSFLFPSPQYGQMSSL